MFTIHLNCARIIILNPNKVIIVFTLFFLFGCIPFRSVQTDQKIDTTSPDNLIQATLTFDIEVPKNTPPGSKIYIDILDEVTGLALNPTRYQLENKDGIHYLINLPFPLGSIVKYRYLLNGNPPTIELNSTGKPVRYRLFHITNPAVIKDRISGWTIQPFSGQTGVIQGKIINRENGTPVPGILISVAGQITFTSSNGIFLIDSVPIGTHHLIAYSVDGAYSPFQQGVVVQPDLTTSATFTLKSAAYVEVTFIAHPPSGAITGAPIRIVGNIYQMGNTFSDLNGGTSVIASRAPYMIRNPDGSYSLRIKLPVGMDLRYKYSLGDGFWNAEHSNNGEFKLRQLIVPARDIIIEDTITSWKTSYSEPITFFTKVPANTPPLDKVSIQFNPHMWMEPVPMWPLGNNQWMYVLYSPMDLVKILNYRYCRNDQCSRAPEVLAKDSQSQDRNISIGSLPQTFSDEVTSWVWWQPATSPTTIVAQDINPHGDFFIAGIELEASYHPATQPYISNAFLTSQLLGANWVVLTPTWTYTGSNLPILEPIPGKDPMWMDTIQQIQWVKSNNLESAIFPQTRFEFVREEWMKQSNQKPNWLSYWYQQYRNFLINYADLAAQTKTAALILGEMGSAPASIQQNPPGRNEPIYSPAEHEDFWRQTISEIRKHYGGKLIWAVDFPDGIKQFPGFIDEMDIIYVLWSSKISDNSNPSYQELQKQIGVQLDNDIQPIQKQFNKPIIIGIDYPSITGAASGCVMINNSCQSSYLLQSDNPDIPSAIYNPSAQSDIYNAFLAAVNTRPFLQGVISRGFYAGAPLQDKSTSIHGKPASDILWYWFPQLTGKTR